MAFVPYVSGALQSMESVSLDAVGVEAVTTQDVYVPDLVWVAQVTLSHFNNTTGGSAWVFEVDGTEYFLNCVYGKGAARVTFALVCGFPFPDGFGDTFCQALANISWFQGDSILIPTPVPFQDNGGGGN
jgi:hypothetical protein